MAGIDQQLHRIYAGMLRMYPARFRGEFAVEMRIIFDEAYTDARRSGLEEALRYVGRELKSLPVSAFREHWREWWNREETVNTSKATTSGENIAQRPSRPGWGEAFLATLPYILIFLLDGLPKLPVLVGWLTWESPGMRALNILLVVIALGAFIVTLAIGWRRKWPLWTASWTMFYVLVALLPVGMLISLVFPELNNYGLGGSAAYLLLPLLIAFLLYGVTRADRLRGLLAALPVVYFLWSPDMEFVPDGIEVFIKAVSTILVSLTVMWIVRNGDWRKSLWVILGLNVVVGLQFAWAGINHGGQLPYSAPGPSLLELIKVFVPQYLAISSILIGPLLAVTFREIGLRSGKNGMVAYRLALLGLLLLIASNLVGFLIGTDSTFASDSFSYRLLDTGIILALGMYAVSLGLLYRAAHRSAALPALPEMLLLAVLPVALPLTLLLPFLSWLAPVSQVYGFPTVFALPDALVLALGVLWLLLSTWLVTRTAQTPARPDVALISPIPEST